MHETGLCSGFRSDQDQSQTVRRRDRVVRPSIRPVGRYQLQTVTDSVGYLGDAEKSGKAATEKGPLINIWQADRIVWHQSRGWRDKVGKPEELELEFLVFSSEKRRAVKTRQPVGQ